MKYDVYDNDNSSYSAHDFIGKYTPSMSEYNVLGVKAKNTKTITAYENIHSFL